MPLLLLLLNALTRLSRPRSKLCIARESWQGGALSVQPPPDRGERGASKHSMLNHVSQLMITWALHRPSTAKEARTSRIRFIALVRGMAQVQSRVLVQNRVMSYQRGLCALHPRPRTCRTVTCVLAVRTVW